MTRSVILAVWLAGCAPPPALSETLARAAMLVGRALSHSPQAGEYCDDGRSTPCEKLLNANGWHW